ncbi:MAG: bifunctional homocysteine S-methyltransferase/methylenetetrahydrofolate reductase [Desulfitobacteriaceae bacterium]|nr:bifunctional homocysteine S-methyltransferase/methylenetetrahydrofolate reductase [Desulfitobacteriaceae bacterium]MDD4345476.1 bifunctional homocysteine S-methyltransferase/methylenetetrahydrofolate reductase [Desulfitobacteriaceae bacterium]MDD4400676.1 bifunctional homocysteine S-methyltransferase/methylenetetrahydrofolate reductase [Desulfitobacteriaceae bacterium]
MTALLQKLRHSLLVGDGAMATELYKLGVPIGVCIQELCLSNPDLICSVHKAYLEAGAGLLETNTFGANREGLIRYGLEHKVGPINQAAVKLARKTARDKAYIVGAMSSVTANRVRTQALDNYRSQFEEQALALLHEGPDGIMLETFLDVDELLLAIEVVRSLTNLPIFAQLALLEAGQTRDGYSVSTAFRELKQAGADIVGLNCRLGPTEILSTLENCQVPIDTPISIFPNAGRLGYDDGEYMYKSSPDYFAESALRLREQGARVIGGCCGTTSAHIKAITGAITGLDPVTRINPEPCAVPDKEIRRPYRIKQEKKSIIDLVKQRHTVIVELDPPKDLSTEIFLHGCCELHKAGADAVTLAENSLANVRMSNLALGAIMKGRYNIEPLLHITCRDRNLIGQQSYLMGLDALGISHILIITGDPSHVGDLPGASSVFDVNSFELIRLTKQLNEGISFSGSVLKQQAKFVVGAAFNPYVLNLETAVKRLERKAASGADYIMTQPVYDTQTVKKIYEATKHIGIPVFIGIMPLTSQRNAEFLHNEVPGIRLSPNSLKRMHGLQGITGRQEGLDISKELIDEAMPYFNGIYLITPFNYYDMTAELTKYVHQKATKQT